MGQSPMAPCPGSVTWAAPLPSPPGPSVWPRGQGALLAAQGSGVQSGASRPASSLGHKGAGEPQLFLTTGGTPGLGAGACIALQGAPGAGLGLDTQLLTWGGGGRLSAPTAQTLPVLCLLTRKVRGWVWPNSSNQHGGDFSPTLGRARSIEDLERVLGSWGLGKTLEGVTDTHGVPRECSAPRFLNDPPPA